jgi:hypothetical protein
VAQWEESVKCLCETQPRPPVDAVSLLQELREAYLGAALVRFCTVGGVRGVVDMSLDPNKRGNPRPIIDQHVESLYQKICQPGMKMDHESPAILTAPREIISLDCLRDMTGKDARDITQALPYLQLIRPHEEREDELESCLWSGRVNRTHLTQDEKNNSMVELNDLRSQQKLASLMNGSHRFHTMERLGADLATRRDEINQLLQLSEHQRDNDYIRKMMVKLNEDALQLTWRVEVYDGKCFISKLSLGPSNLLWLREQNDPGAEACSG